MKRSKTKKLSDASTGKRKETARASDEELRDALRNFDVQKFDKALEKAIKPNR